MIKRVLMPLWAVVLVACSSLDNDIKEVNPSFGRASFIASSSVQSRTWLDESDMSTVRWNNDEALALWAYNSNNDVVYGTDNGYAYFALHKYTTSYNDAYFVGDVPSSDNVASSEEYRYVATCPLPNRTEAGVVTFNIPSVQNGIYNRNSADIMYSVAKNPPLQEGVEGNFTLPFKHLTHSMLIKVPQGRNEIGGKIKKLEITFPQDVVGDLSFDISGMKDGVELQNGSIPVTTLSNGSKSIIVDLSKNLFDVGDYIWLFLAPTTLNGDISFRATDYMGFPSNLVSVNVSKELKAGAVTPITLTIPERGPHTSITVKVDKNNLGENPTVVRFKAPAGAKFVNGSSTMELPYKGLGSYTVGYLDDGNTEKFAGKDITVEFDSPHALYTYTIKGQKSLQANSYSTSIPYVIYEDFSSIKTFSYSDNPGVGKWDSDAAEGRSGVSLSDSKYGGLSTNGWTANRCGAEASTAMRITCRYESGGGLITGHYEGRLDSPQFAILKDGITARLKVTFNYKGSRYSKYNSWGWKNGGNGNGTFNYGYTTIEGGINGEDEIENCILTSYATLPNTAGSNSTSSQNYDGISNTKSFHIPVATSKTRASWRVGSTMSNNNFLGANGNFWLYIDNIVIQIDNN